MDGQGRNFLVTGGAGCQMTSPRYRKESDEVYYVTDAFPTVGARDIDFLKARAQENRRLRCRLCLHPSIDDRLHDMIIVFRRDTYFRPHRHLQRLQSFHVLEGAFSLVILDNDGKIVRVLDIAADESRGALITRIPAGHWYSFVFRTEWLVIQEIAPGPMLPHEREYAPFAPPEGDATAGAYAEGLRERVERFVGKVAAPVASR
jgi:cupin fold WbuC family metalloprotein